LRWRSCASNRHLHILTIHSTRGFTVFYRRIVDWFKDDISRRLFINAGWLLSGKSIAAILGFVTAFLAARGLQSAGYGSLALIVAYVHLVIMLVTFQAWQAIIKFGSDALARGEQTKFRQLIKFGFLLDGSTAVLGTAIALGISSPLLAFLSWDRSLQPLIFLYSWLILFNIGGTPTGLLRLFNRFDLLSLNSVLTAVIRLAGITWCWWSAAGLGMYVLVYLITGIIGQVVLLVMALYQLQKRGLINFLFVPLQGIQINFPGIFNYVWTTNLHATVKVITRELDIIIVAGFSSPGGVGIYKLAKQFAKVLAAPFDPLYQSIFPELARLWSGNIRIKFFTLMRRSTLLVGLGAVTGWISFVVLGSWFIQSVIGPEFGDAYVLAVIYMLGTVIALLTFTFTPALLAMGLPAKSFFAQLTASCIYLSSLIPFMMLFDIAGAAIAYVVYYLVWSVMMLYMLRPQMRELNMAGRDIY
jgi:O-antigen/teichoic acid export membrane protein